ncbi:MAG TPA: hypothetical protein EYQ20_04065 [candidate division Zixibacteria bacterium]|jgi:protein arginine kinase activator|nr:UvrB/UvrC motif-containing protein [Candidatus Latescibacterota bacterium]MDP7236870.1 UvrB/UvrC motif-containing protein [Candidatus Latescibacterota bacterium]HIG45621.1 hypothetical protein [candidate division Zixibacteria bacterium]
MSEALCSQCGMSFSDFNDTGRLGCAGCYTAFRQELIPVFKHVHGYAHHTGKIPVADPQQLEIKMALISLRRELKQAVAQEAFEQAASLRDRIYDIEHKKAPLPAVPR